MKKIHALWLIGLLITISVPLVVQAQVQNNKTLEQEPIVLVKEADEIIYSQDGEKVWPMASITKLMTAMVLLDLKLNWRAAVQLRRQDEVGGARLRVAVNSSYRRIDLLHASLMGSANNATQALMRTSGLTSVNFIKRLNQKALALDMRATRFVDATGMNPKNISTAADIALLIEAASHYQLIREIAGKEEYTLKSVARRPRLHSIKNTNILLTESAAVQLGKTGYLNESGYNFAMLTNGPDKKRVVVVLNAPNKNASFQIAREFGKLGP